jgi:hypothetical protein
VKRPSFQFYPDSWLSAPELRRCSAATRGIWIDLVSLMHSGEPYGHLTTGAAPFTVQEIARVTGESVGKVKAAVAELERNGVCSRTDGGVLFCRRMVRDEEVRETRAAGGHLGASHGAKGGRPRKSEEDGKGFSKTPSRGAGRGSRRNPPSSPTPSSLSLPSEEIGADAPTAESDHSPEEAKTPQAELVLWFRDEWLRSGRPEPFVPGKDDFLRAAQVLKKARGDLAEAKYRGGLMLGTSDPFYREAADLGLLLSAWNKIPNIPRPTSETGELIPTAHYHQPFDGPELKPRSLRRLA